MIRCYAWLIWAAGWLLLAGCESSEVAVDPALLASHRERLLLADEPPSAMAVLDVRELFTGPSEEIHDHPADEGDEGELEFSAEDFEEEPPVAIQPVSHTPQQVAMVGRVGGMPNPWPDAEPDFPWKKETATVFLVDPATAAELGDSGHDHEDQCDCPFCARAATENVTSVAIVNFVDEAGNPIDIGAEQLLQLNDDDTVVVSGTARFVGGEMLVVDADGIYVRR